MAGWEKKKCVSFHTKLKNEQDKIRPSELLARAKINSGNDGLLFGATDFMFGFLLFNVNCVCVCFFLRASAVQLFFVSDIVCTTLFVYPHRICVVYCSVQRITEFQSRQRQTVTSWHVLPLQFELHFGWTWCCSAVVALKMENKYSNFIWSIRRCWPTSQTHSRNPHLLQFTQWKN